MPCYTVRLISQEFKAENEKVLQKAADMLDQRYIKYGDVVQVGPVTVYLGRKEAQASSQEEINILKRAYSQAAVKIAAQAKGWTLEGWKTKAGIKSTVAVKY